MKCTVRYSKQARQDLQSIKQWSVKAFGAAQAIAYLADIRQKMELLREFAGMARRADHIRQGLYSIPSGSHVIFLRFADGEIRVIRILHASMDAECWV